LRTPEHPLRGMDAYELYFTIHVLLTAHEEWKNRDALPAAQRLALHLTCIDLAKPSSGPNQKPPASPGMHPPRLRRHRC